MTEFEKKNLSQFVYFSFENEKMRLMIVNTNCLVAETRSIMAASRMQISGSGVDMHLAFSPSPSHIFFAFF